MVPGRGKWLNRIDFGPARWLLMIVLGVSLLGGTARLLAQETDRARYESALSEWRATYVETLKVWSEFKICEEAEADALRERYLELKQQGDEILHKTIQAATECVANSVTADPELIEFLNRVPRRYFDDFRYGDSARVGRALLKHDPENFALIFNTARSAFFANDFQFAGELFEKWIALEGKLPPELQPLYDSHQQFLTDWQREVEIRQREALQDRLPRILFETTKGPIVVELFEDQAPDIVNNLMVLIENEEKPFFVDLSFFFVLKHQLAVTGSESEDGTRMRPVGIGTQQQQELARGAFRGSFGLDLRNVGPNQQVVSTGCRFLQIPLPELRENTLIVGRVVEGMDVVDRLQATHELNENFDAVRLEEAIPDRIIRVTVQRKPEGKVYQHIDMQRKQN